MSASALIILDVQKGILPMLGDYDREGYLNRVATTAQKAREAGIQIIHVNTSFREGFRDISSRNKFMSPIVAMCKDNGNFIQGHVSTELETAVAPPAGSKDLLVTKKRTSAFTGSDLEVVLRSMGINKLALAGVATSGAVLSTLRQAADMDYDMTIVEDLCLDADEEVHRVLTQKVFTRQADVVSSKEWLESLN
ncbi:isochorismatase family protein [Fusarium austroafricanum]|uniref:Isochorismatase family protein n=1 Tax=Fusarium austroafricanum TaxID=2364996 RepID=A0A8H4KGI3_9HYPO|nr:isochorismatase family protein [Fusarium austroafricanum]